WHVLERERRYEAESEGRVRQLVEDAARELQPFGRDGKPVRGPMLSDLGERLDVYVDAAGDWIAMGRRARTDATLTGKLMFGLGCEMDARSEREVRVRVRREGGDTFTNIPFDALPEPGRALLVTPAGYRECGVAQPPLEVA